MAGNRKGIIDDLSKITGARPHPNDLWKSITDAADSVLLEKRDARMGALTAFYIKQANIKPIEDAAFALMIATAVEQSLELAIMTHFKIPYEEGQYLFEFNRNGPLSDFAAKIKTGYALGIYPKVGMDELNLMRFIRNAFAHSWRQLSFKSDAIARACADLQIPKVRKGEFGDDEVDAKSQYLLSARLLYVYLEWDSVAAGRGPMSYENHPENSMFASIEKLSAG